MNSKRKPPAKVVSLLDVRSDDVITDEDLEAMAKLQAAAWDVERMVHDARVSIERRIRMGAKIAAKRFYWDVELRMARSCKDEEKTG